MTKILICRYGMLGRICSTDPKKKNKKHVRDDAADHTAPIRNHDELDHTDQDYLSAVPGRSRSWTVVGRDHTDHTDHLSQVWNGKKGVTCIGEKRADPFTYCWETYSSLMHYNTNYQVYFQTMVCKRANQCGSEILGTEPHPCATFRGEPSST